MLCNINQKTEHLHPQIQSVGCLFLCMAYCSPLIFSGIEGCKALNYIWNKAKKLNFVDQDGLIVDHNALLDLFCILAVYDDTHHSASENIPDDVIYIVGQYVYHSGHFVVLDKNKTILFDPLITSGAVRWGELKTMRWYHAI